MIVITICSSMLTACNEIKQVGQTVADESIHVAKKAIKSEVDQRINTVLDSLGISLNQVQKDAIIKTLRENPELITNSNEVKKNCYKRINYFNC